MTISPYDLGRLRVRLDARDEDMARARAADALGLIGEGLRYQALAARSEFVIECILDGARLPLIESLS